MRMRSVLATVTAGLAAATCVTAAAPADAHSGTAPGVHACSPAVSITSYSDALDKTTYDGTFVGNLSVQCGYRTDTGLGVSEAQATVPLD
ncbi:hypothetical protein [Streptomyces mirabilis]|uniref:hypothetical protein n=1 Tax=Streptomyces mirabilis TaxID=68239 RepID=UPI003F4B9911